MNQAVNPLLGPNHRYSGAYPSLDEYVGPGAGTRATRVAILTQDIFGPVRNAGIGTAYMHAATFLAEKKFKTTIIFTQGRVSQTRPIDYWIDFYAERGVSFVCAAQEANLATPTTALGWSFNGYRQLRSMAPFDIVHSSECGASAYYALLAKRNRGQFANSAFCIKTSSPHLWSREGNDSTIAIEQGPIIAMAERYCVEQADLVIAPSQHMLEWMEEHSYTLPKHVCVHPNIMPLIADPAPDTALHRVDEIVFFGRLEPRKGIRLFAEAIEQALPKFSRRPKVTFLGKTRADEIDFNFDTFFGELCEQTNLEIKAITDYDATQAIAYLKEPGRLAVIPSLLDNSPFTVYEALVHGFPFLASTVGGIPELVHPEDRNRILFAPRAPALANHLARVMERGAPLARLSFRPLESLAVWERFHLSPALDRISRVDQVAVAADAPAELAYEENKLFPISIESLQERLKSTKEEFVFLRYRAFTIEPAVLETMIASMQARHVDIAVPTIRSLQTGDKSVVVNLQPTMWTKLEFSRLPTVGVLIRSSVLAAALDHIANQPQIVATNIDEIVAAGARKDASIHVYPDIAGTYEGTLKWSFSRAQRNRQVRMLAFRLPADIANIFRVYGALQDERARLSAAQPTLVSLRRLIRILERSRAER